MAVVCFNELFKRKCTVEIEPGNITVTSMLCRKSVHDIEHMAQLIKNFSAESVVLIPLRAQMRTRSYLDNMLSGEEFRDAILRMAEYKKKYGIEFP